ncbi:MAG TPA: DUF2628 domain-containing protein [Xanthobacteraceae bacterium]|jgi:hypothetical protein|nr:DUF2628 domain-containing protein [Xanthobacteraceae bacterium]
MSVFTVHEPPLRYADTTIDPQRFVFVRDGFYVWAFLLAPLWMLRRRLWLVLVLYLVISGVIETGLRFLGASAFLITLTAILISFLVGLEAATLRRFTLRRRGWRNVGVVSGDKVEDAELRFFDTWIRQGANRGRGPASPSAYPPASSAGQSSPPPAGSSGVIGLFPEPGSSR